MNKEDVLKKCTVSGNIVKLPEGTLDRKLYQEVAKALELIGGKWKGGKVWGFVFPADPTELLAKISGGEGVNLKKQYQFFATPAAIADKVVELAQIELQHNVLEPSAGQGALIKAINRILPSKYIDCCELMEVNQMFLEKDPNAIIVGEDYLKFKTRHKYERIVANPPFSNNQDIDHVRKMYEDLRIGGVLVSIVSTHWQISNNKKEVQFREWLEEVNAECIEIPAGEFKESGTSIATVILKIKKR